jgi:predicted negative regulator of RcsB-dependent stress response
MSDKHYTDSGDETHLELALRRSMRWFDANATFLIYGLAVVLAVLAGIVWMQRQPEANTEASALWLDADTAEDYQDIADQFEGTRLGSLARLKQADSLLNNASRNMFTDRETANKELTAAEKALDRLSNSSSIDDAVRDRIAIDQARLAEIRCDGTEASVKTSVDAWQNVIDQNDASVARTIAESRIAKLGNSDASEFYAWFQPLDPKPADDLQMPGMPGPGSNAPNVPLDLDLPVLDDLMLETTDESSESAEEAAQTDSSAQDNAENETKPVDEPAEPEEGSPEPAPAAEEPANSEPEAEVTE